VIVYLWAELSLEDNNIGLIYKIPNGLVEYNIINAQIGTGCLGFMVFIWNWDKIIKLELTQFKIKIYITS